VRAAILEGLTKKVIARTSFRSSHEDVFDLSLLVKRNVLRARLKVWSIRGN
jgi:hypothetical protein